MSKLYNVEHTDIIPKPSSSLPDSALIAALLKTHLLPHLTPLDLSKPLPQLSTGQNQLFALTRALLQVQIINQHSQGSKPILLLDEATSSLDVETEAVMREVIREEFTEKGHTVIAITHRVVEGMDVIVWLGSGRVERVERVGSVVEI